MRWIAILTLAAACGGDDQVGLDSEDPGPDAISATWDDVAPIFEARCSSCHQPDSIGPFSVLSWEDASPWAASIALHVADRTMPPWLVTDDGTCGEYRDSQALTQEEIDLVVAWTESGALPGDRTAVTPAPPPILEDATLVLELPEQAPVAEGDIYAPYDEYRCFRFDNLTDHDQFLTGYEVVPGNAAIVHHVLGMPVDPTATTWDGTTNDEELDRLEAEDERPGWDCLGTVGGSARELSMPVDWAPGQGAVRYPDELGFRLRPQDAFVVQVHYNLADPANEGATDQTDLKLRLEEEVTTEAYLGLPDPFLWTLFDFPFVDMLPAGEEAYEYTWEMSGEDLLWVAYHPAPYLVDTFQIHAVGPHMHGRGRQQRLEIVRADGTESCATDIQRWDFDWQKIYWYQEPIELSVEDTIRVTCTFDTTDAPAAIWPGWGTANEMCLMGMVLTVD